MGIPVGITVGVSSGNVANASAIATLAAVPNKVNYLGTVHMTAGGATAGALVVATITGVVGGPLSYIFAAPTGAAVGSSLILNFDPPLPATAPNTAIVVTLPALGAGNTNATVNIVGFSS
jgi:hypothetical protein